LTGVSEVLTVSIIGAIIALIATSATGYGKVLSVQNKSGVDVFLQSKVC
jgi:hypothetical protein